MASINDTLRPTSLETMVGHTQQRKMLMNYRDKRGYLGQAFWIVGPSGTGKTTMARIIAADVGDDCTIEEVDAIDCTLELLREWERKGACRPLFGNGYAFIVNEAHNLSSKCVSRLQTLLESDAMRHSTWIFTTTDAGQMRLFDGKFDMFPFLSRCLQVYLELTDETKADFIRYAQQVAVSTGNGPDDPAVYFEMLERYQYNLRMALNQIDVGALAMYA